MGYPFTPSEKWDVHTHTTLPPGSYQSLEKFSRYADFIRVREGKSPCCAELVNSKGEVQRVIEHDAYDADARLHDCDKHRVTMQVLSPTPMMIPDYVENAQDAAEICKILNDGNAEIVSLHPSRFTALGALPMQNANAAIKEIERIQALGMKGVEINSNIAGLDLDDPRFFPVFEAAAAMNMAIFIHPWAGFLGVSEAHLKARLAKNWRPWLIVMGMETALAFDAMRSGKVHERLPNLRVLYAHGGGVFPALLGRLEHGAYCRPDLFKDASGKPPQQTVRECGIYTDSLTHDPWMLAFLIESLGASRVALGSDYPYPLGEIDPFDMTSGKDPKGNDRPYESGKCIYPGHMIEHLPCEDAHREEAWKHFSWLPRENADGPRRMPCLSDSQKQRLLSGTAKEWLGWK